MFISFQFCTVIFAQLSTLSGKIIDAKDNSPIIGATVKIKDSGLGTISDMNGQFVIKSSLPVTLVISYVGFKTQEVRVNNREYFSVLLEEKSLKVSRNKSVVEPSPEIISDRIEKKSIGTETDFSKSKYKLPVNIYGDNFNFEPINKILKEKVMEWGVAYHTTNFTNFYFATNTISGSLQKQLGVEFSLTTLYFSPIIIDASIFRDWYSTYNTDIHHNGLKIAISSILFPCGKYFIPYAGIGGQLSSLSNNDATAESGTSTLFWKCGVKTFVLNNFPITLEYVQSVFNNTKPENQLKIGIGLSLSI